MFVSSTGYSTPPIFVVGGFVFVSVCILKEGGLGLGLGFVTGGLLSFGLGFVTGGLLSFGLGFVTGGLGLGFVTGGLGLGL